MASVLEKIPEIFPEEFFNISQPDTPIVQIQIRTKISSSGRIDGDSDWTEVHMEPGMTNYFNSMNIEDAGGLQKVIISFFDKNFANVENAIVRSLVVTKAANELATNQTIPKNDTKYFEFKLDNQISTNIRIRFGYSEKGGAEFIDATSFNDSDFSGRAGSKKTVVRSPWIYLQMIGTKFDLREEGLFVEITAFSVMDTFLNKAKLLRRFAVLNGTPKDILTTIGEIIKKVAPDSFDYKFINDPINPKTETAEKQGFIEINLGAEVDESRKSWRTISSILKEVMSKIPSRKYDEDDNDITSEDGEAETAEKVSKEIPYNYYIRQEVPPKGKLKTFLEFKYPDPIKEPQKVMRTYIWKEYGQSIVKNLNIESQVDFASLNAQIFTVSPDGEQANLFIGRPRSSEGTPNSESTVHLGRITDVTEALSKDDYSYTFVSNTINSASDGQVTMGARIASRVIHNLNQGVFKGSIEIPGDPFYLFDNKLSPYQFLIKIIVQRPGYLDHNNNYQGLSVSYLSGIYSVSKITHNINASGFSTTLEIVRWPIEGK